MLHDTAASLIWEFFNLRPLATTAPHSTQVPPHYHNSLHPRQPGKMRDCWNWIQPWFPLFIEWEVRYYHIPWEAWEFDRFHKRDLYENPVCWQRYGLKPDSVVSKLCTGNIAHDDAQVIAGQIFLLPQPSFSLSATIEQLFSTVPVTALPPDLQTKCHRPSA